LVMMRAQGLRTAVNAAASGEDVGSWQVMGGGSERGAGR